MTLQFSDADEDFRARLTTFLTEHAPGKPPKDRAERLAYEKQWAATKFEHGWAGPSWPREIGGMDLPFSQQVIYQEEMAGSRAPRHPGTGLNLVGPTLIKHGTAEQKDRYLRRLLRADDLWAQAFSEPEAGSDLPSLRTSARQDGADYVVNGHKVWNTQADDADRFFTLVRTGAPDSRQNGISYLLIDARSPGITVRPLRDMTGQAHFAEIYFDDVRVPVANRVGEENGGWKIARTTLGHERAADALNQAAFYRRVFDELVRLAKELGANKDPVTLDQLASYEIRVRVMHLNAMRTISAIMATGEPGPASSTARLYNTILEQDLHVFASDLIGLNSVLAAGDPYAVERGRWVMGMLRTRASTIGGGTSEIQRNTIAEQLLQLPRDPMMPAR
jgi:alkylation response protein AidB-like acyl-CoA dehydrogenase